jgi:hypothetical protein
MSLATYDDVNLILRLYELRREEKMRAARSWFGANCKPKSLAEFNQICPPGSEANAFARQVMSYWDMVASFVTNGVLNQELVFQNNRELLLVWMRVEPIVEEIRTTYKDPTYLKNLEAVAKHYIDYLNRADPETAPAFRARVGG